MIFARWIVCTVLGAVAGALAGATYAFVTTKPPEAENG